MLAILFQLDDLKELEEDIMQCTTMSFSSVSLMAGSTTKSLNEPLHHVKCISLVAQHCLLWNIIRTQYKSEKVSERNHKILMLRSKSACCRFKNMLTAVDRTMLSSDL